MSGLNFTPAVRHEAKARVALIGPTGSGKTHTALELAGTLGQNIAVIDTENGSASLYADKFGFQQATWPPPYDAAKLAAAIGDAAHRFDVLIIDSLTHFWSGDGGVLDIVDREASRNRGNTFAAWKAGTPLWRGLLDALIHAPCHVIVTMRSKMEYVQQRDEQTGRTRVERLGMAPQARNDVEFEFTVVGEMDQAHRLTITKSRCDLLADQVAAPHQAARVGQTLAAWLSSAVPAPVAPVQPLADEPTPEPGHSPDGITDAQITKLAICFRELGITDRDDRVRFLADAAGRPITSSKELTKAEASEIIDGLDRPASTPEAPGAT